MKAHEARGILAACFRPSLGWVVAIVASLSGQARPALAQAASLDPTRLTPVGDILFFSGTEGSTGRELWKATAASPRVELVKDFVAGSASSSPNSLKGLDGTLYLSLGEGSALWKSDGTSTGTVLVGSFPAVPPDRFSGNLAPLGVLGGRIIFRIDNWFSLCCPAITHIYATDGTEAGTELLATFAQKSLNTSFQYPISPLVFNGALYFDAGGGIWRTDGTKMGTTRIKSFGPSPGAFYWGTPIEFGNRFLFSAFFSASFGGPVTSAELWESDGTEGGTRRLKSIYPSQLTRVGSSVLFIGFPGNNRTELWRTDGTDAGTIALAEIPNGGAGASPSELTDVNGTLFMVVRPTIETFQLWKSDGTALGTVMVKDYQAGLVRSLKSFEGALYFLGYDADHGQELWRSDGTPSGTVMVKNIAEGGVSSAPAELVSVGKVLYFSANDGVTGRGLWRSDGTAAGTVPMVGPPSLTPRLVNLSSRARVQTGDDVMIAGFIVGGNAPKKVLITARGPSLAPPPYNVPDTLADPFLQLFAGATQIDFNDDFGTRANAGEIPVDKRPANAKEAAILTTLSPGAYTAIATGVDATAGVGIVEVFEIDLPEIPLINISTRSRVETGDNVMIAGFVIHGNAPRTVVVTARGPSLAAAPFNVPDTLSDPYLRIYSGQTVIYENDNWLDWPTASQIPDAQKPKSPRDAAMRVTLSPGAYTAIVGGGTASAGRGVAIIEVFVQ